MSRQLYEYHPTSGYRFIPDLRVRIPHEAGGYLLKTNAQGFRSNHTFTAAKTEGTRRVLLFGDSFTAGDGVSNGKRYGDVLEELIPSCEVYNYGLSGTGTDQQYLIYQEEAKAKEIDHDVLVISVLVENIRRVAAKYRNFSDGSGEEKLLAKPYYSLEEPKSKGGKKELTLHGVPVPKEPLSKESVAESEVDMGGRFHKLRGVINRLGLKDAAQKLTSYQPLPHYNEPTNEDWLLMRAILEEWIAGHPKPVLLFVIPLYQYIEETSDPTHYLRRFQELSEHSSCHLCDPLPHLQTHNKATRRQFRFPKDVHPTALGHRAFAEALAPQIAALLPD